MESKASIRRMLAFLSRRGTSGAEVRAAVREKDVAQASLRRVEDHLAQLVQGVTDYAIFLLTPEGIVSTWNSGAERIKGYRANEIVGKHFSTFYPPDVAASGWPQIELERAARLGRHEDEGWRIRKDGTRFWANVLITAVRGPDGELEGFSKITRDLTERMHHEEGLRQAAAQLGVRVDERTAELEHANRALQREIEERAKLESELRRRVADLAEEDRRKSEFLATLAHELRNPLAPIQYAHEILRLSEDDPRRRAEAHAILTRQLQQMVRLIDDLLDLSRITRNKLELRRERVDLATVLQDAAETARPLIETRQHRLAIHHAESQIVLHADRARLAQVFSNLLSNAAKFTDRGGSIEVTAAREGTEGVVRIRDTGIGIAPEMLPRIFDMFVQADRSLERTQSGLGIGLTLVQRVVQMHGGRVGARSEGRGKGSEFTVRLPAEPQAAVTLAARDEAARGEPPGALGPEVPRRRVLVADDNEDAVRSLSLVLRAMGHEVVTARNGEEAVLAAETSRPDLALLDIGMPIVNGYDAARRIREQPWGAGLPLVALTGWGLEEDRSQARESGFDRHLVKPVDAETLRALMSELPANDRPNAGPGAP